MEPVHYHHHRTILYNLATSDMGLSIIKRMLLNGIDKGIGVYTNKEAFLQNNMVDKALPKQLEKSILCWKNCTIMVAKERDYIAQAAAILSILKTYPTGRCKQLKCSGCNKNY
jgi:hypothetical protein